MRVRRTHRLGEGELARQRRLWRDRIVCRRGGGRGREVPRVRRVEEVTGMDRGRLLARLDIVFGVWLLLWVVIRESVLGKIE